MTADILREKFLVFFQARQHKLVESDSLVPKEDPTVLFTPAGMNQFKKEFMGFDAGFKRAATCQRCLRTDDLEKVGKTSSHHTFFEMLGNFSFGDYFKKEAITWAWEFLTVELKIPADKLWVSVYQDDDEAYCIWKEQISLPVEKIVRLGDEDNFWPAEARTKGPNGPCGPCSEIFYDFGVQPGCAEKNCNPACSCGRFVEIWNLVFTQFNRRQDAFLEPLPNKNIDTGMGLERLTAVMQGKQNNFETELFQPIVQEIISKLPGLKVSFEQKLLYTITDHLRAAVFSIFDGILPSNEGRGYVVRKIIRKAILHLNNLGINEPFLYRLVPCLTEIMRRPYPELTKRRDEIVQILLTEEKNFIRTLGSSAELFKNKFTEFITRPDPLAVGRAAFLLHDTYGIPLELTVQWLDKQGISFSSLAFDQAMQEQKTRSKTGSVMSGEVFGAKSLELKVAASKFIGYQQDNVETAILGILKDGQQLVKAAAGENLEIILEQTPFYPESGGQVGDTGKLISGGNVFEVVDTQRIDNVILHSGKIISGNLKNGDRVKAQINVQRRLNIARNHTATHILQAALRQVLGNHVQQQGSLVAEEKFRFDFTHFKGLSAEEIIRVEEVANSCIAANQTVDCQEMTFKAARNAGALAFFEEKYGEHVRVVNIGNFSKELCGGTHLGNLTEIGIIKILSESSVASGIRRIEGVTADFARQFICQQREKSILEAQKKDKLKELKAQKKQRNLEFNHRLQEVLSRLTENTIELKSVNVVTALEPDLEMSDLRFLADKLKEKLQSGVIALGSHDALGQRAYLVIAVTPDLLSRGFDAGEFIRQVAPAIGGSGGGRADFAQAGGRHPENFVLAFEKLRAIIKDCI